MNPEPYQLSVFGYVAPLTGKLSKGKRANNEMVVNIVVLQFGFGGDAKG
jgi:hypothetical protein